MVGVKSDKVCFMLPKRNKEKKYLQKIINLCDSAINVNSQNATVYYLKCNS